MSIEHDAWVENTIEIIEDLLDVDFNIFEDADTIGKFKILAKTPGTNAKAAIKKYLELKDITR